MSQEVLALRLFTEPVTAGANLAAKSLVTAAGAVPANAAAAYGGILNDCASGDVVDVVTMGIVPVIATGTVTKGANVEALQSTIKTKDGAAVTFAGVQDFAAGIKVGRAHSSGVAGDVVLVEIAGVQVTS